MMTGVLLAVVSALTGPSPAGGRMPGAPVASGLMAAGLCCGVLLIVVAAHPRRGRPRSVVPAPGIRRDRRRAPQPRSGSRRDLRARQPRSGIRRPSPRAQLPTPSPPSGPPGPDPFEEWMDALRPPRP